MRLPRGIPAASLKREQAVASGHRGDCLPRGIPAASLKRRQVGYRSRCSTGLPRGIPAASLKRRRCFRLRPTGVGSSAGNTRGLIEATRPARR